MYLVLFSMAHLTVIDMIKGACKMIKLDFSNFIVGVKMYRKVASSNPSCLEAHDDFFRLLTKGIFDPYVL